MGSVVEFLNAAGRPFVGWSLAMLVQSSVLIAILLTLDLVLRRRIRAVVRYAVWSLVLVKLVLPPSLASPFGLAALAPPESRIADLFDPAGPDLDPRPEQDLLILADAEAPQSTPSNAATPAVRPVSGRDEGPGLSGVRAGGPHRPEVLLSWRGLVLVVWLIAVLTFVLLLGQRALFVAGLVRQSRPPEASIEALLLDCCRQLALSRRPGIRISPNAVSPVVCGLWRTTILMPEGLVNELRPGQVRGVLLHELAHVKRGDLWVNLVQAMLQIAYFYNPLVWLANWLIRRIREQAVDEAVLVALGDNARDYPETLVDVARLALARPSLGLRLIGVAEHPTALKERIQSMLTRTIPTSAQLGLKGLLLILALGLVVLPMAVTGGSGSGFPVWQRTDRYVSPDPNGFFPDDVAGGKNLDALIQATDKDRRPDEEILTTVRQGLRRTTQDRTRILGWIGEKYIWGKDPQNTQAIEILYHAVPWEQGTAVYFGLSVVKDKSPNILRALAEICLKGEEVGRITWGIGDQREPLLSYIRPHLQDADPATREIAEVLVKHFEGQVDFEPWKRQRELERKKVRYGGQMPEIRQRLLTGGSASRRSDLSLIVGHDLFPLMDDSFLDAMEVCAKDGDRGVRSEAARVTGLRWIWGGQEQPPRVIALMQQLARDENRDVRHNAVYFGLSVLRQKDRPTVEQLVRMALRDHEPNLHGRIVWGLRQGPQEEMQSWVRQVLSDELKAISVEDLHARASLQFLFRATLGAVPPAEWGLQGVAERYPDDLFVVAVSAKKGTATAGTEHLWPEVKKVLPSGLAAEPITSPNRGGPTVCLVAVRGKVTAEGAAKALAGSSTLAAGEVTPLPPETQLYFEETGRSSRVPAAVTRVSGGASGSPQVAPLQAMIDAATPGDTVVVPAGTYTQPVRIGKPLNVKGASVDQCVLEVTADEPALTVDAKGQGQVAVSGLTLRWQLATSDKGIARPCALYVKDTEASVTGCRFVPLGNSQRSPVAVQIEGFSKATISDCQSEGFDYVICYGKGTEGLVEDCVVRDCGHQGIINYEGSTLRVERCIVIGSQFHGLRCTGGTLTARDNLLVDNRVSGVYLGNKNGRGDLTNNLMIRNGAGVGGYYQAAFRVENNVILDSSSAGLGMWDTCRLTIQNNIFQANPKALVAYAKGGTKDTNTLGPNTFWKNTANTENCQPAAGSIEADPLFQDPNSGDFSLRPGAASQHKQGLSSPEVLRTLWHKSKK